MGYNIGIRIVDEFLAKGNITRCNNFRETAELIGKVAFKMFLGITVEVTRKMFKMIFQERGKCLSLIHYTSPTTSFV